MGRVRVPHPPNGTPEIKGASALRLLQPREGGTDPGDDIWLYPTQPALGWRKSGKPSWKKVSEQCLHTFFNLLECWLSQVQFQALG